MEQPLKSETSPSGSLLQNLVLFGRVLRNAGLDVTPRHINDLVNALGYIDIGRRQDFHATARTILVHRREEFRIFDRAFQLFWRKHNFSLATRKEREAFDPNRPIVETIQSISVVSGDSPDQDAEEKDEMPELPVLTYSPHEILRKKDFASFTREELEQAKHFMNEMTWEVSERASRRKIHGGSEYFDARAMLRESAKYGGDIFSLKWKQTRFKPRQLIALCDISGSMEGYSRILLHFLHIMENAHIRVEAFTFSTRLSRITRQLRVKDVDAALRAVAWAVDDWAGGTRIGEALRTFNFKWSRRVLQAGAIVIIISDGWDRGEPELLERELRRLKRNVYRVIWLNPLSATPGFEPLTRGLRAALPFVDDFLPIHNLDSLSSLAKHLGNLSTA